MIIAGVFASEALDSSGEVLDVKGADISDFEEGRGVINYEHRSAEEEKIPGAEIVGKIIHAHKVFGAKDCRNALEKEAWERIEMPFIWGVVRLLDAAGHPGAINLAASIRDAHANNEPVTIGFSIEGSTLDRGKGSDSHILKRTMARRVALTFRPCNKTSQLALVADPKAPEGFDKMPGTKGVLEQTLKAEDPMFRRLGGYERIYQPEELEKALAAGGYDAAPSTLTGGAALQVEHLSGRRRHLRNQVSAAIRDWDKKTPLDKFLKARLPDVDEGFLEKFADIARQHALAKAELLIKRKAEGKLPLDPKVPKLHKPEAPGEDDDLDDVKDDGVTPLTIRGVPVAANPKLAAIRPRANAPEGARAFHFDPESGILHTPRGSFPAHNPDTESEASKNAFHQALHDPDATKAHDYALDQWVNLHKRMKEGNLPPEVGAHAAVFAMLSPNTPVPYQELMHGHFVDTMHHTGFDPSKPGSAKESRAAYRDWKGRDNPHVFPETSPEHWRQVGDALRITNDSKTTGRKEGDIGSFMMAPNKWKNIAKIPQFHGELMSLVNKHKGDTRKVGEELLGEKMKFQKWEQKRKTALKAGKPDIGEYTGTKLAGLAPKTMRYMLGMMGGGDSLVPDTHFARHFYGLDKAKDRRTIKYIRDSILWNENHGHVLRGMDEWYQKNHPAVKHLQQHPVHGEYFRQNPDAAVFPAFWKHWAAIIPHERARGMTTGGFNQATTHRPYFEGVAPYLKSEEAFDPMDPLVLRTAKQHADWAKEYGEVPAMQLYMRFLLPQLLEHAHARGGLKEKIKKATDLMKGFDRLMTDPERGPVQFQGRRIQPGLIVRRSKYTPGQVQNPEHYSVLGHTPTHFIGVKGENVNPDTVNHADLVRIPRSELGVTKPSGQRLSVASYPKDLDESPLVHADSHGVGEYNHRPTSRALVHGLTLQPGADVPADFQSSQASTSYWARNPQGKRVFVKGNETDEGGMGTARSEGAYYNLAHDVFGLGHYLPTVGVVRHPQTGSENAVIEHVRNPQHVEQGELNDEQAETMDRLHKRGDLHKMAIMDYVLGNADRNSTNHLFTSDEPGFKLIDHGQAFRHGDDRSERLPQYMNLNPAAEHSAMHPETQKWLRGLSSADLVHHMQRLEVPEPTIRQAVKRLEDLRQHSAANPQLPFGHLWNRVQGRRPVYDLHNDVTSKAEPEDGHGRLVQAVRNGLSDELRRAPWKGTPNCMAGHCYVASEALFHLMGGRNSGYVPHQLQHEGASHWFLKNPSTGDILDPTAEQFEAPVPYNNARGKGFMTAKPSRRAQVVIDRAIARGKTPAGAP